MKQKMKLIYISHARLPTEKAHGYQIAKMCESFGFQGVETELWLPHRRAYQTEDAYQAYGLENTFWIKKIWIIDLLRKGAPFQKILYRIQTSIFLLHIVCSRFPHDAVVYTRSADIAFVCSLRSRKVIYEDHGWPKKTGLYLLLLKRVHYIVAITKGIADLYHKQDSTLKKILVAPDAVELDVFKDAPQREKVRAEFGISSSAKIILYTGSFYLYSWKGVDVVLEAAQYLPAECAVVLIGGTSAEVKSLRKQYQSRSIHIVERKSQTHIPMYLKAADVLVLPNKKGDIASERYTSPLKLFEYMAAKVPIVASKLPSIEEILNTSNACLVEPNDSRALAEGIIRLLQQPEHSQLLAEKAYQDVQHNTWKKRAHTILDFISHD
ncbi:MAG: glycosyltransferase [bacterium]|nr:glycosyltransferase [bacterium]